MILNYCTKPIPRLPLSYIKTGRGCDCDARGRERIDVIIGIKLAVESRVAN